VHAWEEMNNNCGIMTHDGTMVRGFISRDPIYYPKDEDVNKD